jgi:uncharacterized membrane protein YadS
MIPHSLDTPLAATAPLGSVAVQMGTLVKLVRVLMLGPVVLGLSLLARRARDQADKARHTSPSTDWCRGTSWAS